MLIPTTARNCITVIVESPNKTPTGVKNTIIWTNNKIKILIFIKLLLNKPFLNAKVLNSLQL